MKIKMGVDPRGVQWDDSILYHIAMTIEWGIGIASAVAIVVLVVRFQAGGLVGCWCR